MDPKNVASLSLKELVAEYNRLSPSAPVKKFKDRATAERRLKELLAKAAPPKARVVRGAASADKVGRPNSEYQVTLGKGTTKLHSESTRSAIVNYLAAARGNTATTSELRTLLDGKNPAGFVRKLAEKNWVKIKPIPTSTQSAAA